MKIGEVKELLGAKVLCGEDLLGGEVLTACASDMMSDVLAFSKEHALLLTGLTNPQVLRTADMLDIRCVVFVRGKVPGEEMLELAREYGVTVMTTKLALYVASGTLYMGGLRAG